MVIDLLNHRRAHPAAFEFAGAVPDGHSAALVVKATAEGAEHAARMIAAWPGHLPRPALIIVADAPFPPPRLARYRLRAISGEAVLTVRVPYLFALRQLDRQAALKARGRVTRTARSLQRALLSKGPNP
ncbi:hypothetical protein [Nonomuraea dietziae]|uniref:Uncharacterized protein n=1 Tax=Nonomuraea dietziae TaxID=65515 RepID=A0A7W5VCX2_9ACTN|nr:hypothetical protein [Nonomuraea dietziae]MBB3733769.1 hypothetical protein [Nonomuraea dietziae]